MDIYYLHLQQFALKERLSVARYGQQKNNNKLAKCIYVRKFSFIDWLQTFKTFVLLLYICCLCFFCFMYTTCYLRQYSILQIVSKSNGEKTWASLRGKIMCAREKSRCPRKKCVRCFRNLPTESSSLCRLSRGLNLSPLGHFLNSKVKWWSGEMVKCVHHFTFCIFSGSPVEFVHHEL
jgi:hypothetical protein